MLSVATLETSSSFVSLFPLCAALGLALADVASAAELFGVNRRCKSSPDLSNRPDTRTLSKVTSAMLTCCSNAFTFKSCMANAGMAMISCELLAVPVVAGKESALNTRLLTANSPRSRINWKAVSCSKTSACKLKLTLPSTKSASIKSFESDQSGVSATSFIAMSVVTFIGDN